MDPVVDQGMLENELFQLMEGTADAAFTVTEDGEILSWNKAAERLFGYPAAEVLHRSCFQVLHGRGALGTQVCHEHCSVLACSAGRTDVPNFDMETRTRTGEPLWVNISTLVFRNPRTQRRLVVHTARDITEQKRTADLVHKMLELSRQLTEVSVPPAHAEPAAELSEQERRILQLFAEGKSSSEIGRTLTISLQTLRNHLHHINQKLRTHNRLEAVMHAMQRKLI